MHVLVTRDVRKLAAQLALCHGHVTDALFELGSAGLSLRESTAALTPVLNLAVGTVADMGEVAKTAPPEPVSFVNAVAICALVNDPRTVSFPTEDTCPVRSALVVTVPAVNPAAVPVRFVATPEVGVPNTGVTNVGEVART